MNSVFWITCGAIIGANMRYFVSRLCVKYLSSVIPYGTLIVNVTGSFIVGFFLAWTVERVFVDPRWKPFIAIGFCGAYTTYSSYSYETITLLEQSDYSLAALNFICNNVFSLLATVAGIALARAL
ncbi:MAG: fluoride efflux transporter CrcB [Legionella sp.]